MVEVNMVEILLSLEVLANLQNAQQGKKKTSLVSGLNPNHYEIVLENTKEGLLTIIQDLVS